MSLQDYTVDSDNFEYQDELPETFCFPCCVCKYRLKRDNEDPCRGCGHNANRVEESA